ncbi:lariat debranching enzyme, C-terminal domain-domain-containing protein [Kockovaella imperatae]|uniref:Lariat debranching enzyme, C-terminal domain-domain-containing protein n=1 Tax=Kockovaella imperatae TaxID=4999 RepID=A0A1Y1UKV7_9TREE|nr:lariat debranching enzyme, C-terminal domain-domain-containing protein [Kockovaella imperatae]ORX38688.1 lariat debranching enzyme, C-terminal domain-domain-containing protein [Kockovaella imperatae]
MLIAVQGCCHGSLSTIYASIAKFESQSEQHRRVRLLLLCGDFQALRSEHDYASLAVPPKYRALGTFHEYYSGKQVAPVLTLVIGGNHEASNYMQELYHGGWLAPNIYYLGAAGSVMVDGLRIVGSSGIYKAHNYGKGHYEKVPYRDSQLRSVYHTRHYDIAKLMQLSPRPHTVFMSHDWPTEIPKHGNTADLLRRKPFFTSEVNSNTLGSPPLLNVLRYLKPNHWFAAHLHVKFAAVYEHEAGASSTKEVLNSRPTLNPDEIDLDLDDGVQSPVDNPDEITIDDGNDDVLSETNPATENPDEITIEDEDESDLEDHMKEHVAHELAQGRTGGEINPDEINIGDDEEFDAPVIPNGALSDPVLDALKVDESADLVEAARSQAGPNAAHGIIGPVSASLPAPEKHGEPGPSTVQARRTSESATSSTSTKFLALDKPGRGRDFIQFLDIPTPSSIAEDQYPRMTFDPHWLAISRALHSHLSTELRQPPLPRQDEMDRMIQLELDKIEQDGLLVPRIKGQGEQDGPVELVWERGPIDIARVQQFWPTAPAHGEPGGSPTAWYTNPQTEAFCGMLGIQNKINPAPP